MPADSTSSTLPRPDVAPTRPITSSIEGSYAVEGSTARVEIHGLRGGFYQVSSSEGWEGVGVLEGTKYIGVFRRKGSLGVPDGTLGRHVIDWTSAFAPTVRATNDSPGAQVVTQYWRRMRNTPEAPYTGYRPAFGEHVYVEELPDAVIKVAPIYPDAAREAGIDGQVMVQALVLEDGTVGDVRVVKSIPGLDQAALASVRQWRFKPALSKGAPVSVWVAVPVKFSLH